MKTALKTLFSTAVLLPVCVGGGKICAQEIGDEFLVGTSVYQVTGANLITNGSFDDGVNGWYDGAWTASSITNSVVSTSGGYDGGAYITISGAGATAAQTLRNVIPVETGKTYLFRCYTSGQAPSRGNLAYNGLWKGTGDGGKTEGDQLYRLQWGSKTNGSTSQWTVNNYVFTPDEYSYVVIRSGWNSNTKLDGFFIGEVTLSSDISTTQTLGSWTGSANANGSGQHWDGNGETKYYDNSSWWASATFEMSQNVSLPTGAYVLRTAGRAAANDGTDSYMSIDGQSVYFYSKGDSGLGIETNGNENFSSSGTYANGNNGRGWEWRNMPILVTETKDVSIKFGYSINYTSDPSKSWSWASICAPTLYKVDLTTGMMMPLLRQAIQEGNNISGIHSKAKAYISSELSAAKAITLSSTASAAITAYNELTAKLAEAKARGEQGVLLDNEITKAELLGASTTAAVAVKDNSSATSAEIASAINALKVTEFTYANTTYQYAVELGTWNKEGDTGSLTKQHWSGEAHEYLEQSSAAWESNSWTIKYDQNLTLPAGNYVFKVAGRKAVSDGVTMSLTVKNGETILGTVSDFPEGDNGLGINKLGATSFDSSDEAGFANNGNGRGWEWRFVKFTLAEDATVNVAVNAVATIQHMWVSFCDAAVLTDNEANISLITYNIALNSARTIIANTEAYGNVTGSEKTALQAAIDADDTLDKSSKSVIDAATTALNSAANAFTSAKSAYDNFAAACAKEYTEDTEKYPYASHAKFEAIATAQDAAATSASDAAVKATAITNAYLAYVESNAMAEGNATHDVLNLIQNPDFADGTEGWTLGNTGGSLGVQSGEPLTAADGSTPAYIDANNNDNNTNSISQTITLPAGKYLFSVSARGDTRIKKLQLEVGDQTKELTRYGNSGQTFGRGWNDYSMEYVQAADGEVTVKVASYAAGSGDANKSPGWWSATRFRLVKLAGTESVTLAVKANKYGTFIAPFAVAIPDGVKAYKVTDVADNKLTTEEVEGTIPANTPVILQNTTAEPVNKPVEGVSIATETTYTVGKLTGTLAASTVAASTETELRYAMQTQDGVQAFYKVTADFTSTPNRCYLTVPVETGASVRAFFLDIEDGEATGISGVNSIAAEDVTAVYSASGAKLNGLQKGVNIVRTADGKTKKVMVK